VKVKSFLLAVLGNPVTGKLFTVTALLYTMARLNQYFDRIADTVRVLADLTPPPARLPAFYCRPQVFWGKFIYYYQSYFIATERSF